MDVAHKTRVPAGKAMADSVNHAVVFRQSRYGSIDEGDYLNCPMDKDTESEGHLIFPLSSQKTSFLQTDYSASF